MSKFRKKPVVIDAFEWDGVTERNQQYALTFPSNAPTWLSNAVKKGTVRVNPGTNLSTPQLVVDTMEGTMNANIGDFIIRGVEGEIYPCKASIFNATYDPVEE